MIENKAIKYENSIRIKSTFTKEDEKNNPDKIAGVEYTYIPIPTTSSKAFERLRQLTGQQLCEWYQKEFIDTYPVINLNIIESEIKELENFIQQAKELSLSIAFKNKVNGITTKNDEKYEYLRLINHYYNKHICNYSFSSISCQVYGKYVLYYNWLLQLRMVNEILSTDKNEDRTKVFIHKKFEEMDRLGWCYAFQTENDFQTFLKILTDFFDHKSIDLPKNTICLKRNCKTKLAAILGEIHKELSENPLKSDHNYLNIIRILKPFHDEKDLYKSLTR